MNKDQKEEKEKKDEAKNVIDTGQSVYWSSLTTRLVTQGVLVTLECKGEFMQLLVE